MPERFIVEGSELIPAGETTDYVLTDEVVGMLGTFTVELAALPEGEHSATLNLPARLEPQPEYGHIDSREWTVFVHFIYDVYWSESPLAEFCASAAHMLTTGSANFDPTDYHEAAEGVLSEAQLADVKEAVAAYEEGANRGVWDPNELFDLTEEFCGVTYDERWMAMS